MDGASCALALVMPLLSSSSSPLLLLLCCCDGVCQQQRQACWQTPRSRCGFTARCRDGLATRQHGPGNSREVFSLFFLLLMVTEKRETPKQHLAGHLHNGLLALTGEKGTRHAKARRGKRKKADKKREQHRIRKKLSQEKNGRKRTRRAAVGREVSLCGTPPPTLLVVALLSCPRNWSLPSLVSFFVSTSHEAEIPMGAQKAQRPLVKKGSMRQCADAFFFSVYPDCSVPQADQEKEGQTKRARARHTRL